MFVRNFFTAFGLAVSTAATLLAGGIVMSETLAAPDVINPSTTRVPAKIDLKVYVDDNFNFFQKVAIIKGLDEWDRATNGMVTFHTVNERWTSDQNFHDVGQPDENGDITCSHSLHVINVTSEQQYVADIEEQLSQPIYGFTQSKCAYKFVLIVTDRANNNDIIKQTMTHEMGHVLALDHTPVPYRSIMFPGDGYAARCVTDLDIYQLCMDDFFGCNPATMNPCKPGVPAWTPPPQPDPSE
jgi:hypothetical protein